MFLDDKLREIISSIDKSDNKSIRKGVDKLIAACFDSIDEQLNGNTSKNGYITQFKRVNKTWKRVIDETENSPIKRDGFEIILSEKGLDKYL